VATNWELALAKMEKTLIDFALKVAKWLYWMAGLWLVLQVAMGNIPGVVKALIGWRIIWVAGMKLWGYSVQAAQRVRELEQRAKKQPRTAWQWPGLEDLKPLEMPELKRPQIGARPQGAPAADVRALKAQYDQLKALVRMTRGTPSGEYFGSQLRAVGEELMRALQAQGRTLEAQRVFYEMQQLLGRLRPGLGAAWRKSWLSRMIESMPTVGPSGATVVTAGGVSMRPAYAGAAAGVGGLGQLMMQQAYIGISCASIRVLRGSVSIEGRDFEAAVDDMMARDVMRG